MSRDDRRRWDEKHAAALAAGVPPTAEGAPALVAAADAWIGRSGRALDVASGRGAATIALARRGLDVVAVDVSLVALAEVRRRADEAGVGRRVHTIVSDLDDGLPPELGAFDVVVCAYFHAPPLWPALRAALAPGGVLLVETMTKMNLVMGIPAPDERWLVTPGEIRGAAEGLEIVLHEEGLRGGRHVARLIARRAAGRAPATRPEE